MNSNKYYLSHRIFFLIFIGFNQLVLFWTHSVIYTTGVNFVPLLNDNKIYFASAMILLSVSFVIGNIFLYVGHNRFLGNLYHLSAVWLGTMFWLLVAAFAVHVVNLVTFGYLSEVALGNITLILYIFALALSTYGLYNQKDIRLMRIDVAIENLPEIWIGRRAVLFTDSHYGPVHTISDAWKLAKLIKNEEADIVFMSGDFYDGPPTNFVALGEAFKDVTPALGKFFVTGNHEEYAGKARAIGGVEAGGFFVADGRITLIDGVQIVGIPYEPHETKAELSDMLSSIGYKSDTPSIALKHVPNDLDELAIEGIDLVLCGHTHRGQIWPFSLLAKWVYKGFEYGLKPLENMQVYTSSGVGTWGPPQRIGTHSELVVITFKAK